jgi:TusA-related sulfurtransferase
MSEEITITKTLDVCGKICPYPDMNTMTTLKKMSKGEVLEVLLDYPIKRRDINSFRSSNSMGPTTAW